MTQLLQLTKLQEPLEEEDISNTEGQPNKYYEKYKKSSK